MRAANRGPAAAAANRAALLASARRLFAEQGYDVPLSAVAKDAGVGQGSLYRHFPGRDALATAIVEETMARLTAMVDEGAGFAELWRTVVDTLVGSAGFLEAVLGPRGELRGRRPSQEMAALLAGPLARAQAAGAVSPGLSVDDLMLTLAMVHGATHRRPDARERRDAAYRALALVGRGLELS